MGAAGYRLQRDESADRTFTAALGDAKGLKLALSDVGGTSGWLIPTKGRGRPRPVCRASARQTSSGSAALVERTVEALLDDFDNTSGSWFNKNGPTVYDSVPIIAGSILWWNVVVGNSISR
jgi:hypothetical protein